MSFETLAFKYTPPATIPDAVPASAAQAAVLFNATAQAHASSAATLRSRLAALLDTNLYLQDMLLARSSGLAIEFDPAVDPETARALGTIYTDLPVPTSLTIGMYNRMLDAEMTALQLESSLGNSSANEVNPFQAAAVTQITQTIEAGLLESGQFQFQLPLLLRQLKGDAVIFNNLSEQIGQYPVVASPAVTGLAGSNPNLISMAGLDVSEELNGVMNGALDSFERSYASVYQLSATIGVVAQDVTNILNTYILEPAVNLIRIVSMLQMLSGLTNKSRLKGVVKGLGGFVFVRLMIEASAMTFMLDRFVQVALQPMQSAVSGIGLMLHQVSAAAAVANTVVKGVQGSYTNVTGALKGCSMAYSCGLPHNAGAKKPDMPILAGISSGSLAMVAQLDWAMSTVSRKSALLQESFRKLMARRLGDMNAQLDLMCSMQALNTAMELARSVMSFNGNKSPSIAATAATAKPVSPVAAVGQILAASQSATGSSFVVANGQTQVIAPSVPIPPSNVQTVLAKGGLNMSVASTSGVKTLVASTGVS